jgi:hypothetical protein
MGTTGDVKLTRGRTDEEDNKEYDPNQERMSVFNRRQQRKTRLNFEKLKEQVKMLKCIRLYSWPREVVKRGPITCT